MDAHLKPDAAPEVRQTASRLRDGDGGASAAASAAGSAASASTALHERPRRLVVFAGPHKSASSSVQEFFHRHASNGDDGRRRWSRAPALDGWTWPSNPKRGGMYQPRKAFAVLVNERTRRPDLCRLVHGSVLQALRAEPSTNLILGTEEFDRFGAAPWSHRDGIGAIRDLVGAVEGQVREVRAASAADAGAAPPPQPLSVEVVVNYRRPRRDQWVSIWRQLSRKDRKAYAQFMCPDRPSGRDNNGTTTTTEAHWRLWEYLDAVANPLGLVGAMFDELGVGSDGGVLSKVHLMDMRGIADAALDISHVIGCRVLGAKPCPNGWLSLRQDEGGGTASAGGGAAAATGNTTTALRENEKTGDPELAADQLEDMETLLRLRDCSYQGRMESLQRDGSLQIHLGESIWEDCPKLTTGPGGSVAPWNVTSTDDILELLQDQLGCGSGRLSSDLIRQWKTRYSAGKGGAGTATTDGRVGDSFNDAKHGRHGGGRRPTTEATPRTADDDASLYRAARIQSALLLTVVLLLTASLILSRRRSVLGKKHQRADGTTTRNARPAHFG